MVTLDGEIVITGRYPANDEILNLLELPAQMLLPKGTVSVSCCTNEDKNSSCCCGTSETDAEENKKDEKGCCCSGEHCC